MSNYIRTEELKQSLRNRFLREKSVLWKGNNVSLQSIHDRANFEFGKPDTCEKCLKSNLKNSEIHWSNKTHTYTMPLIRAEWQRLCRSCHKKYDAKYNRKNKQNNKHD